MVIEWIKSDLWNSATLAKKVTSKLREKWEYNPNYELPLYLYLYICDVGDLANALADVIMEEQDEQG